MKHIFIIISGFLIVLPSYALCPVDGGETVCSLPSFREQVSPIYKDNGGLNSFGAKPDVQLQPLKRDSGIQNMRDTNNNLNYNSSCQFGVCLPNVNNTIMMQKNND